MWPGFKVHVVDRASNALRGGPRPLKSTLSAAPRAPPLSPAVAMTDGILPCDVVSGETPFCARWPTTGNVVDSQTEAEIRSAVQKSLAPFAKEGILMNQLSDLMLRPCMQRMCFHVQLVEGELFVVAPPDMSACRKGVSSAARFGCPDTPPNSEGSWLDRDTCLREKHIPQSPICDAAWRRKQPGVAVPDWWYAPTYPHVTEWHFAAGLNFSNCQSAGQSAAGDHNYVFSRLRMGGMLRLLLRAYRRCVRTLRVLFHPWRAD